MKTSIQSIRRRKREAGQALVETAIVYPVLCFFILGVVQMTMMHQARLMLEYAAFNAARAGSVWNADHDKMTRAALISMIASRPSWPGIGGVGAINDYKDMIGAGFLLIGGNTLTSGLSGAISEITGGSINTSVFNVVDVAILSPTKGDLRDGQKEIDFDSSGDAFKERRLGQLTIRVKYYYNLVIPFANWAIWNTWYIKRSTGMQDLYEVNSIIGQLQRLGFDLDTLPTGQRYPFRIGFKALNLTENPGFWRTAFEIMDKDQNSNPYECMTDGDWLTMAFLPNVFPNSTSKFYIPMVTAHTIRMQSNIFKRNLPTLNEAQCK